jgi:FkbM family methyltransferase
MPKYRNVITPSVYGPLIINRFDTVIGIAISTRGDWEKEQLDLILSVLQACTPADTAITILDVGANIGTHTLAFAQFPFKRVTVHAYEAQRQVFYMLAGSVALNSLDHVYCHHKAVSDQTNQAISVPVLDYDSPANFGGVEIEPAVNPDFTGKALPGAHEPIETVRIDDREFDNLKLLKIDVEGMENKVLAGATATIDRHRPLIFVEYGKTDFTALLQFLRGKNYVSYFVPGMNLFSLPAELGMVIKGAELAGD